MLLLRSPDPYSTKSSQENGLLLIHLQPHTAPLVERKQSAAPHDLPQRITTPWQKHFTEASASPADRARRPPPDLFGEPPLPRYPLEWVLVVDWWSSWVQLVDTVHSLSLSSFPEHQRHEMATELQPRIWAMPPLNLFRARSPSSAILRMDCVLDDWRHRTWFQIGPWTQTWLWAFGLGGLNHFNTSNWFALFISVSYFQFFQQLHNGLGLYDYLLLVERLLRRICSYIFSALSYTIDDFMATFVVLADIVQALGGYYFLSRYLGGYYFLSRYYQDPNVADMIYHFRSQSTHDFTATHLLSENFHEGLLAHLLKVQVTSPLEYGRESAGLSTTILYCYFGYISFLFQITSEWPSFLHGIHFLIRDATVAASGGPYLPSHFYHICTLRFLLAASALFLALGILPKDCWYCIVLFSRVDFLPLSSSEEPSWKLIFLSYQCNFSVWACPSEFVFLFF